MVLTWASVIDGATSPWTSSYRPNHGNPCSVYVFGLIGVGSGLFPVIETQSTEASIGKPGEQDLFKFTAKTAGRYTIETEGPTDIVMSLCGPERQTNLITQDDDSGTDRNAKIVTELMSGTYYVQVRHYNSTGGTGSYKIKVSK